MYLSYPRFDLREDPSGLTKESTHTGQTESVRGVKLKV